MNKLYTNHIVFRLIFPVVFGILAYIIVLMIFDSVQLIIENFFSKEVAFFILLSFALFESLRLAYRFLDKKISIEKNNKLNFLIYLLISILISVLIVSLFVNLYFRIIEKTSVFKTELIVFNFIMLFAGILFLSVHYSILLIQKHTQKALEIENLEIENLQKRLNLLKQSIQPEILFEGLESLILLIHKDIKLADDFIDELSGFYRIIIEEQNSEIILLNEELKISDKLVNLLNQRYKYLFFKPFKDIAQNRPDKNLFIIPGIVRQVLFMAVQSNLISEHLPLIINYHIKNNYLCIKYKSHKKLNIKSNRQIDNFKEKHKLYSDKVIVEEWNDDYYQIKIPLLTQI